VNIGGETQNIVFQESLVSNSFGTPSTSWKPRGHMWPSPPHPLASRQNLLCPLLQFCWQERHKR
jgi:hypothetical protein